MSQQSIAVSSGRRLERGPTVPVQFRPRWPLGGLPGLIGLRLDPLRFLSELAAEHGDLVQFRSGPHEIYLLNDPELIREVLVTHDRRFTKGRGLRIAERLLGQGLLTSEGTFHLRQRRLAQPAFHRQRIAGYARVMAEYADRWQRDCPPGTTIDLAEEMRGLTLRIAAKTLFDTEVSEEIGAISEALTQSLLLYRWAMLPFADRLERYVPILTRRFNRARARLDATVYRMIAERRASGEDRGDLLSMLLLARDDEGDGGAMSDEQLRDEAMTLLLAGHETTANAFAWTWYLLSQNPEAEARMHAEIDSVLAGRLPTADDLPRLPYTRQVFTESMRLFPPAWVIARQAAEECPLGEFTLPKGSPILMSPWVMHHDPRWYSDPFRFEPERWANDAAAQNPRFTYFPFGGGSRVCIGEQFAWMEGVLVLAAIAAGRRFRLVSGHPVIPQPLITLRPKHGIRVTVESR